MPRPPLFLAHLLPPLDKLLISLLNNLSSADWERPTLAGKWRVRDIVAHLIDGNVRTLAMLRDGYYGEQPGQVSSYSDLVGWLNQLNADWVKACQRLSTPVLIDWLSSSGKDYCDFLASLEPFAPAAFSVAWAGEKQSANWFHVAREYTEKWHHQQQIRLAVDQTNALYRPTFYQPYLETSLRGLPHHYRQVEAPESTVLQISFRGLGGGTWRMQRTATAWELLATEEAPVADCHITIPAQLAWRIFTKGIDRGIAQKQASIEGDSRWGTPFFHLTAVMA